MSFSTLAEAAVGVLRTADPDAKVAAALAVGEAWRTGEITEVGSCPPPERPARPATPELLAPRHMPKRSLTPGKGKAALLHAIAHIEFTAIDLAWDILARFTDENLPRAYYDDWVRVGVEEAQHFALLQDQLRAMGRTYGAFPAHDGLWEIAMKTSHSLAARLALVPLTHEVRGLDTTPSSLERVRESGDLALAAIFERIYSDEISHVAVGSRWLRWLAERDGNDPLALYQREVRLHYKGGLKPPFNTEARRAAGMPPDWYEPLARGDELEYRP